MEYLMIVGFISVILIPMMIIFYTYTGNTEDEIISNQIHKIGLKIGDTAQSMYYLGEPSRTQIKAHFPRNINNITISSNEIVFFVNTKNGVDEVVIYSPIALQGGLNPHSGYHNINIRSRGTYVEIAD
jgi:hypothetical protein